ncbi:MAG: VC0807 family protein [Actinoallomurus sp.]
MSRKPQLGLRAVLGSLALNGAGPLLAYVLARPYLSSDVGALAVAMAVPVVCTIALFGWRRRLDAVGVVAVVAFGVALLVVLLSGGNAFVLKLQEAVVTGPVGLVLLVSAAVRRPLLLVVIRLLSKEDSREGGETAERRRHHASTVLTTIMGGTLVAHAVALTVLALTLSTAQVLAVSRPAGLAVLGLGMVVLLWYRGRLRAAVRTSGRPSSGSVAKELP